MTLLRLLVLMTLLAAVLHWLLAVYFRSLRTEALEKRWDRDRPDGIDRDSYVRQGLEIYDRSFRRHLIALIWGVPFALVFAAVIYTNYLQTYR